MQFDYEAHWTTTNKGLAFDLLPTLPGNLISMPGRLDTLIQPPLRAPKPGITSRSQPASQLNIGTQLTSTGQTWHQTHAMACSLNFVSYNLKLQKKTPLNNTILTPMDTKMFNFTVVCILAVITSFWSHFPIHFLQNSWSGCLVLIILY